MQEFRELQLRTIFAHTSPCTRVLLVIMEQLAAFLAAPPTSWPVTRLPRPSERRGRTAPESSRAQGLSAAFARQQERLHDAALQEHQERRRQEYALSATRAASYRQEYARAAARAASYRARNLEAQTSADSTSTQSDTDASP